MTRRLFLETGSVAVVGGMFKSDYLHSLGNDKPLAEIGLQLYTVRDDMKIDLFKTLKRVAEVGFNHVECAGYSNGKFYEKPKEEFKMILDDLGLKMYSGHIGTGFHKDGMKMGLNLKFDAVCEDAVFMGQKYIGVGYIEPEERRSIDDYKKFVELLNISSETAKKHNLIFFHHNHDFEFIPINGIVPYDIILNNTDKNLVKLELDHYWTTKAKVDSVNLMKKNPGRFPLWHIKDMDKTKGGAFTEVGTGVIDYQKIFNQREISGNKYFYIEQDTCKKMSPFQSIALSYKNVKKLKF